MIRIACLLLLFVCSVSATDLKVMSFNLRFASDKQPHAWPDRRPLVKQLLKLKDPDIIGTQEGLFAQLKHIAEDSPKYGWLGLGREGGSRGEFMAIYYRKDRFEVLEFDHFWLSDTPNVIASTTWGNQVKRMVTWARFLDRKSGETFYFVNTHFDHQVQASREKSAELIVNKLGAFNQNLPLILLGDFNVPGRSNVVYDTLVNGLGLQDARVVSKSVSGDRINTFHNYKGIIENGVHIDWILFRASGWTAKKFEVITHGKGTNYPSDHFPITAEFKIGG
jgi:endonuclease/exonuclease/phosphatase family metal-dependent hydrolase